MRTFRVPASWAFVTVTVSILVVTAGILVFTRSHASTSPTVTGDVRVDAYPASAAADLQGVDPSVASGPNGTIGIVWEAIDPIVPTLDFTSETNLSFEIWYAVSADGGRTFSVPSLVTTASECWRPTLSFGSNGIALVAAVCYPNSTAYVELFHADPGSTSFTAVTVTTGPGIDTGDAWVVVGLDGTIDVVYSGGLGVMVAEASAGGFTFGPPSLLVALAASVTSASVSPTGTISLGLFSENGLVSFVTWDGTVTPVPAHLFEPVNLSGSVYIDEPTLSIPGPAAAASGTSDFVVYITRDDTQLDLLRSSDGGVTWNSPLPLENVSNATLRMPAVVWDSESGTLVVAWEESSGGFWNTYASVFSPGSGSLQPPLKVSSSDGYPTLVQNWHGTHLALAKVGPDDYCVAWNDGRGNASPDVGFGHIYASIFSPA